MFHDTLVPCAERRNINMKIRDPPKERYKQEGTYFTRENPERNKA